MNIIYNGKSVELNEINLKLGPYVVSPNPISFRGGDLKTERGEELIGSDLVLKNLEKIANKLSCKLNKDSDKVYIVGPSIIVGEDQ